VGQLGGEWIARGTAAAAAPAGSQQAGQEQTPDEHEQLTTAHLVPKRTPSADDASQFRSREISAAHTTQDAQTVAIVPTKGRRTSTSPKLRSGTCAAPRRGPSRWSRRHRRRAGARASEAWDCG